MSGWETDYTRADRAARSEMVQDGWKKDDG